MVAPPGPMPNSASTSSSSTATVGPISSIKPASRSHSASISSVHFAQPLSRRLASHSGAHAPFLPTKSATDPLYDASERLVSPPTTPAPTPKPSTSPTFEAPNHTGSGRKVIGSALAHGKRASVVTGGYESSSSDSSNDHARSTRRRATTLTFPVSAVPISRSSSDKSLQREPKRLAAVSRHSSRDLLRSSVLRPVHPSIPNPPSRVSSNASSRSAVRSSRSDLASPAKAKRSQSPARRELRPIVTSSPDSARSRKGKERAEPRRDVLTSSLGMVTAGSGPTLTADQINALLADSDVAAAIRLMGTPQTPSLPPPRPLASAPSSSDDLHHPFLVSAPPALTEESSPARDRAISISTTASSPRQIRRSESVDIPSASTLAHRRRASSRATLGASDGGHVPFTHHLPPPPVESDDGAGTEPALSIAVSIPSLPDAKTGRRKRLSALFGLKHKTSDSSVQTLLPPEPIPTDKEKERQKRETDMRNKERQRRQDEIEEDRYYRALQQVSAHPHCVYLADHAKLHLWALYEHVFDGLENPPRFNPVAILRWKHKVEEQDSARKAWESRKAHLGASVESFSSQSKKKDPFARWAYTVDDIARYKENEGHVDYFIPPKEEVAPLASVSELTALEHPASSNGSVKTDDAQLRAVSNPSSTELLRRSDSRGSFEPLSRSPSNDNRRKISHRPHQSLGHIGPFSIANHVVDKIGSMARRQKTLLPGDMSDSTMEESPLRAHPLRQSTSPVDRFHPELLPRSRTERLLRRPYEHNGRGTTTDEESFSRRRVFPRMDRKPVLDTSGSNEDRVEQPQVTAIEPQPVPNLPFEDIEARRKEEEMEAAVYAERLRKLRAAQAGLDQVSASLYIVDDNIKHYGAQLVHLQRAAKVTTGFQFQDDTGADGAPIVDRYIRDRLQAADSRLYDIRSALQDLDETRVQAADKLRGMVQNINRLQAKTGEVDHWARKNILEIAELKNSRERLLRQREKRPFWQRPELDYIANLGSRLAGKIVQTTYWTVNLVMGAVGLSETTDGSKVSWWTQAWHITRFWAIAILVCVLLVFFWAGGG